MPSRDSNGAAWQWDGGSGFNMLSNRHDRKKETANDPKAFV
jgi:hypothetical protein